MTILHQSLRRSLHYDPSASGSALLEVPGDVRCVLDVGCGTGEAARQLKLARPGVCVHGLTISSSEASAASRHLDKVLVWDIEDQRPPPLPSGYDVIVFSHVLEHVAWPASVLERFCPLLADGGVTLVLVPNVAHWRTRLRLGLGGFSYEDGGVLDVTHLRFFTYKTASDVVPPCMRVVRRFVRGHCPQPLLRKALPHTLSAAFDSLSLRILPNLFAVDVGLILGRA